MKILPFAPCGMVMDVIRACYKTRIRPFKDSDAVTQIRWFRAVEGAKSFPGVRVFGSLIWSSDHAPGDGPGEVYDFPRTFDKGEPNTFYDGQSYCGTAAMFAGEALSTDPPLQTNDQGLVKCCLGIPPDGLGFAIGLGGQPIAGNAAQGKWGFALGLGGALVSGTPLIGGVRLALGLGGKPSPFIGGRLGFAFMIGGGLGPMPMIFGRPGLEFTMGIYAPSPGYTISGGLGVQLGLGVSPASTPAPGYTISGGLGVQLGLGVSPASTPAPGYTISGGLGVQLGLGVSPASTPGNRWFTQSTNTDTTCDVFAKVNQDFARPVGSGTTSATFASGAIAERIVYDVAFTGASGVYAVSLNFITISVGVTGVRFRLQVVDASCAVVLNGAYSSTFTSTGVKTMTDTLSWPAGGIRLRVSIEASGSGVGPKLIVVGNGATSFVDTP